MIGYSKYVTDQYAQLNLQYNFTDPNNQTYKTCAIISLACYLLSLIDYKQLSYVSRIGLYVTAVVITYLTLEVSIKYFFFKKLVGPPQAWVSFNPDFLNVFAQASGAYEGIPLVPPLYSNARNKRNFSFTMTFCIVTLGLWIMIYSPLAVGVWGDKVREIILLNLEYGDFQSFLKGAYSIVMLMNVGIIFMPIKDIIHGIVKGQVVEFVKLLIIIPTIMFSSQIQGIELFYLLNASMCTCFFQIILPNYMVIQVR